MRTKALFFAILISMSFTGCIEIIEDLTINTDRSGAYKLTINLSASKMRVKSLMSMDSLRGKKIPGESDIKNAVRELVSFLNTQKGLSDAKSDINFDDLICKFSVQFQTLEDLQRGIHAFSSEKLDEPIDFFAVFELSSSRFKRNGIRELIDEDWVQKIDKEDLEQLKESSLVLITRFDKPLEETEQLSVAISKNKLAGMFKTNLLDIIQHKVADDYTLHFENE
jgi:hypothetical protein